LTLLDPCHVRFPKHDLALGGCGKRDGISQARGSHDGAPKTSGRRRAKPGDAALRSTRCSSFNPWIKVHQRNHSGPRIPFVGDNERLGHFGRRSSPAAARIPPRPRPLLSLPTCDIPLRNAILCPAFVPIVGRVKAIPPTSRPATSRSIPVKSWSVGSSAAAVAGRHPRQKVLHSDLAPERSVVEAIHR
jgi:hypothetical protein